MPPPVAVAFARSPAPPAVVSSHADWSWLTGARLQAYVAAENTYSQSVVQQRLRPLQRALATEMTRRQQSWQTYAERTPPERVGAFEYGTRRAPGADVTALPVLFRRPVASPDSDQLVLDARDLCAWLGVDSFVHIGASWSDTLAGTVRAHAIACARVCAFTRTLCVVCGVCVCVCVFHHQQVV